MKLAKDEVIDKDAGTVTISLKSRKLLIRAAILLVIGIAALTLTLSLLSYKFYRESKNNLQRYSDLWITNIKRGYVKFDTSDGEYHWVEMPEDQ